MTKNKTEKFGLSSFLSYLCTVFDGETGTIVLVCIIYLTLGCDWYAENVYYVPKIELYVKMKKMEGHHARIYFSRDLEFSSDYIEYVNSPGQPNLDVYFVPPDSLYAIYLHTGDSISISQKNFKIKDVRKVMIDVLGREYKGGPTTVPVPTVFLTDSSFLKRPTFNFRTNDDATGFYCWDTEDKMMSIIHVQRNESNKER